jgi:hypothetical protein
MPDTAIVTQAIFFCAHVLFSLPQDTSFSCVVTALFLRPILKILGEVGNTRSAGQISLEKTKWLTLVGTSLAVVSSTVFYINSGLYMVLGTDGHPFFANPYLNILVFGINLDSVLNDVGMLVACGVLKKVKYELVIGHFSTAVVHKVEPALQFEFESVRV